MKILVKFIHEERGNIIKMKSLTMIPENSETVIIDKVKYIVKYREFNLDEDGEVIRVIINTQ